MILCHLLFLTSHFLLIFLKYPCFSSVYVAPSLGFFCLRVSDTDQLSAMVSIRRRKLLGLCSGSSSSFQLPKFSNNGIVSRNPIQSKSVSVHPMPSLDLSQPKEINTSNLCTASSNISDSSSSKGEQNQPFSGREIKRRKRRKRKHFKGQEPCILRGVYFKNNRWQAAIKVDKKQIHLGTFRTQEEAAHLYDRAAFMCGREPNFELPEEEKEGLRKYKWDEFVIMARSSIINKKPQKRVEQGSIMKPGRTAAGSNNQDIEQGATAALGSEHAQLDSSLSYFAS